MRQNLGQHFLQNAAVLKKIAGAVRPEPHKTIIEIGPGHGELTKFLAQKTGDSRLILLERDPALAAELRTAFPNADIVEGDALKTLPKVVSRIKKSDPYKLVGNLPYYLTGFLLRTVGELARKPERAVFTIQKEVAERIVEKAPRMNRLAAAVQFWADPKILGLISRRDFLPPPDVDSATIELRVKKDLPGRASFRSYEAALHVIFQQPRKTLANNLLAAVPIARAELVDKLRELKIDPETRPQNLDVSDILRIAKTFKNWG